MIKKITSWEEFDVAYKAAPPELKQLIDSDTITTFVTNFLETNALPENLFRDLVLVVSDLALRLYSLADIIDTLETDLKLPKEASDKLVIEIKKFLDQQQITTAAGGAEPELPMSTPVPVRTMQTDAEKARVTPQVGYTRDSEHFTSEEEHVIRATSQADTLEKRPLLSGLPNYQAPEGGDKSNHATE